MSAETLRRAASQMREDWDNPKDRRMFPRPAASWLAVAGLLDAQAERAEIGFAGKVYEHAHAVAVAYLGESA